MIVKILTVDKLHGAVYLPSPVFNALARAIQGGAGLYLETDTARIQIQQNQIKTYRINQNIVAVQSLYFYNISRLAVEISKQSIVFRDLSDLSIYTFLQLSEGAGQVYSPPPAPPNQTVKIRLSRKYKNKMLSMLNQMI